MLYTFSGDKLLPRNPAAIEAMKATELHLTRETDVWRAWIGFNASHSLGLMGLGATLIGVSAQAPETFDRSLLWPVGALSWVAMYYVLSKRYFFSIPRRGVTVAFLLLLTGLVGRKMQTKGAN